MGTPERQTRQYLINLFKQHGFGPRTDMGQNFLIDLNLIDLIVRSAQLDPDDVVLEIGAGTGGLTTRFAEVAAEVIAVEVDRNMVRLARPVIEPLDNVTLLETDALKNKNHFAPVLLEAIDRSLAADSRRRLKLVSNLPYNIATPVVSNLVATELPWQRMVVTIQWELGQRMAASAGTGTYGALSAWLQAQCRVKILRRLPPNVFWPRPQVHSAIIRLEPDERARAQIANRAFFHDFLRRAFTQRRKYLRGVVAGMYRKQLSKPEVARVFAELELPDDARAEQLDPQTLVAVANRIGQVIDAAAVVGKT